MLVRISNHAVFDADPIAVQLPSFTWPLPKCLTMRKLQVDYINVLNLEWANL